MNEQQKADLSKKRGQAAVHISDPEERKKFISAQGEAEKKGASDADYEHLDREADDTIATQGQNKSVGVPSYRHGTDYVPRTGLAKLHEGEAVLTKEENEKRNMATEKKHNVSLYRAMSHLNKGGLHRALRVPEGEAIPAAKLNAAKHSENEHIRHMAHFAETMKGFKHGGK
jgi:hypothetical protein